MLKEGASPVDLEGSERVCFTFIAAEDYQGREFDADSKNALIEAAKDMELNEEYINELETNL